MLPCLKGQNLRAKHFDLTFEKCSFECLNYLLVKSEKQPTFAPVIKTNMLNLSWSEPTM